VAAQHLLPRADSGGRVAAWGVVLPDADLRRAIADGRDVREAGLPEGSRSIDDDLARLQADGTVTATAVADVRARIGD
jgi:Tfp pilus assembly pilus retraction ATPase PilT